jgi:hypothetical protein
MARPVAVAALVVALSAACSRSSDAPAGSGGTLRASEVTWASELRGPATLAARSYIDGDVSLLRMDSYAYGMPCGGPCLLERRGGDGALRWEVELPERAQRTQVALSPSGDALVAYDVCLGPVPYESSGSRLVSVSPEGTVRWTADLGSVSVAQLSVRPGGDAAVLTRPIGTGWGTVSLRRYAAADGARGVDEELPADATAAAIDATGALLVLSATHLTRLGAGGAVSWERALPAAGAANIWVLRPLPDGTTVVTGSFGRDLTWGAMSLRYVPDRYFNPSEFVAIVDATGEPVWGEAGYGLTAGLDDRGRTIVAGNLRTSTCSTPFVRARDASGEIAWERLLDADGCDVAAFSGIVASHGTVFVAGSLRPTGEEGNALWMGDTRLWRGTGFAGAFREPVP